VSGPVVDGSGAVQLGLIIVQRTAEELGCTIDMVTRAGKGTRFSVIIDKNGGNPSCRVEPGAAAASM
jgi:anti-sigma-K factor RskA